MTQEKQIFTELSSGSLIDRCIGLILVLATVLLESPAVIRTFERGFQRLSFRASLEIIAMIVLLRMRDSQFNRSLIDLFSLALVYKLIFLASCFFADTSTYYFIWTFLERPVMATLMVLVVVRLLWPANIPFPCIGVHGFQSGDSFIVPSIYPYAAMIVAMAVGLMSPELPSWWYPAVLGSATVFILLKFGPATNDTVTIVMDENYNNKSKLRIYEQAINESARLISKLRQGRKPDEVVTTSSDEKKDGESQE